MRRMQAGYSSMLLVQLTHKNPFEHQQWCEKYRFTISYIQHLSTPPNPLWCNSRHHHSKALCLDDEAPNHDDKAFHHQS